MDEYKKDDRGRSKAKRLTEADPHTKVDSSTWTPPEAENAGVKTGARPLVKRLYKKGGKVVGKHEGKDSVKHAGRMPRKSGGRTEHKAPWVDDFINRDVRMANDKREGVKHDGAFKKGGKAHKLGGGMVGDNPVSMQNRSMSQASGAMKKGGKIRHREYGGTDPIGAMIDANDFPPSKPSQTLNAVSPKTEMAPDKPMKPKDRIPASTNFGAKKGGKIKHPDEKADRQLIKKMIKPEAFKAKGGSAHSKDCTCKMCGGGRAMKYSGGGIFSGDSKTKVPGVTGGRKARKDGGGANTPDFSSAYYDLFTGWHNLDKANPDQIAAMRPEDQARAYEAQGQAPTRMGGMPGAGYGARKSRPAPSTTGLGGMGSHPVMDPMQQSDYASQAGVGSPRGMSATADQIRDYQTQQAQQAMRADNASISAPGPATNYSGQRVQPGLAGRGASAPPAAPTYQDHLPPAMQRAQGYKPGIMDPSTGATWHGSAPNTGTEPLSNAQVDMMNRYDALNQARGGRSQHAKGGRTKGKTNINIIIGGGHGHQQPPMGMGQMPNAPVNPQRLPPAGPQGGPPMPPPSPQGMPPMPPQGMPMPRKSGGRTSYPIETGSGGAEARLDKIKAYGLTPPRKK